MSIKVVTVVVLLWIKIGLPLQAHYYLGNNVVQILSLHCVERKRATRINTHVYMPACGAEHKPQDLSLLVLGI